MMMVRPCQKSNVFVGTGFKMQRSLSRQAKAGLDAYFPFYNTQGPTWPWGTQHQPRWSTEAWCDRRSRQQRGDGSQAEH